MSGQSFITVTGRVSEIFGHRFVLTSSLGKILADLGRKGAETVTLRVGDEVTLTGEQKPSEVKVQTIEVGDRTVELAPGKRHDHDEAVERLALQSVRSAGFEPVGAAKHKPKHIEILGRREHEHVKFHVELDGRIRHRKPVELPPQGGKAS